MPSIKVNLPEPPEGWEYTGEYRLPSKGEEFLASEGDFKTANMNHLSSHGFILRKKRWRAEEDFVYFYVDSDGDVESDEETLLAYSDLRWKIGNYFRTEEEAEKAAEAFKEFFKQFTLGA